MLTAVPHAQLDIQRFLRILDAKAQAHLPARGDSARRFAVKGVERMMFKNHVFKTLHLFKNYAPPVCARGLANF